MTVTLYLMAIPAQAMICPPDIPTCIDTQYSLRVPMRFELPKDYDHTQMPPCAGEWVRLSDGPLRGNFGIVFSASVEVDGVVLRIYRGDEFVALVHTGEIKNWECRETPKGKPVA